MRWTGPHSRRDLRGAPPHSLLHPRRQGSPPGVWRASSLERSRWRLCCGFCSRRAPPCPFAFGSGCRRGGLRKGRRRARLVLPRYFLLARASARAGTRKSRLRARGGRGGRARLGELIQVRVGSPQRRTSNQWPLHFQISQWCVSFSRSGRAAGVEASASCVDECSSATATPRPSPAHKKALWPVREPGGVAESSNACLSPEVRPQLDALGLQNLATMSEASDQDELEIMLR